jgi:hypothetical protein
VLVLGLVIVGVGAVVVIYTVRAVKPKRVRFSTGLLLSLNSSPAGGLKVWGCPQPDRSRREGSLVEFGAEAGVAASAPCWRRQRPGGPP